jgi:hypothetical protein
MINKVDFNAKTLTSNAGVFLLFEHAKNEGIFDFIESDLVFDWVCFSYRIFFRLL